MIVFFRNLILTNFFFEAEIQLWVQLKSSDAVAAASRPTQVLANASSSVDTFIDAIKKKFSPDLDNVPSARITLHLTEHSHAISSTTTLESLGSAGKNGDAPLIVKVEAWSQGLGVKRGILDCYDIVLTRQIRIASFLFYSTTCSLSHQ